MKYQSTFETSKRWNISARRIALLCAENRIEGAQKAGNNWIIPENAVKPADARIKTGKYRKNMNPKSNLYTHRR